MKQSLQFLTHLATDRRVSASTQNQALSAILFLYREVLSVELPWLENIVRAKRAARIPVVPSPEEVAALLCHVDGTFRIIAQLLYGSGLRLMEALRLRVKDIDFAYAQIIVRDGKGKKDRVTVLPKSVASPLRSHLRLVREQHEAALRRGYAGAELPSALARRDPKAHTDWGWQYVFPLRRDLRAIHVVPRFAATTFTRPACNVPFAKPQRSDVSRTRKSGHSA